jgi:hypothetical protein
MDPDPTLNFEKGETIYENRKLAEWIKFWKVLGAITLPWWPAMYTYEFYAGDGAPSLQWMSNNFGFWHDIPRQTQDSGDWWNVEKARYCDDRDYMNMPYAVKRSLARPSHTFYQVAVLALLHMASSNYVTKMIYNKEKDIVFVYRQDGFIHEKEYVYEMHHLEQMVPHTVLSWKDLSANKEDGVLTIHCMSTKSDLKFYNDKKYWNLDERDDFIRQTNNLWNDYTDKRNGHIFKTQTFATGSKEQILAVSLTSKTNRKKE